MKKIKFLYIVLVLLLSSCSIKNIEQFIESKPSDVYSHYIKSRLALQNQDIDQSIEYLKDAIEIDGDSITLQRDLASLYIRKNLKDKALTTIEEYFLKHPDSAEALMIIGRIKDLLKHDINSVTKVYEKVLILDDRKSAAYLFLGDLYIKNRNYDDANRIYLKYSNRFPKNFLGFYYLGKIALETKDYLKAKKYLNRSLSLSADISSFFLLADVHLELKEFKEAKSLYEKILILDPLNVKAIFEFSILSKTKSNFYLQYLIKNFDNKKYLLSHIRNYIKKSKKFKKPLKTLIYLSENVRNSSDLNYLIAVLFEQIKDSNNALKFYKKVKIKSDSYVKASISIASIFQNQKKLSEASKVLYKVHELIPKNQEIILYLGVLYSVLKDNKSAEKIIKKGLQLNKKNYSLHYRLGIIYDAQKKKKLMFQQMKKVIKLKPDHANALNYLGYSYADSGINLDEAEKLITQALKFKPNDGYITDSLGWVYYKKGQYKKASTWIKRALTKVPNDPIVLEHLGDIYKKLNDNISALKYYKKALKFYEKDKAKLIKKIKRIKGLYLEQK